MLLLLNWRIVPPWLGRRSSQAEGMPRYSVDAYKFGVSRCEKKVCCSCAKQALGFHAPTRLFVNSVGETVGTCGPNAHSFAAATVSTAVSTDVVALWGRSTETRAWAISPLGRILSTVRQPCQLLVFNTTRIQHTHTNTHLSSFQLCFELRDGKPRIRWCSGSQ